VQTHARYTTDKICMTDAASAIAAAKFALAQVMIAPTGITCNNQDCTPSTCHTAIWYWTVGQLIVHTVTDGELTCAWAEWIGGEFQVICTACTHI
jgi:hypothetical protein